MIGVPRRDLAALDPIDSDAFTRRYAVGAPPAGRPDPLWYREIRPDRELPQGVAPEALREAFFQAVALRERCSDADRAELDRRTDWPVAAVTGGRTTEPDAVVGVLMLGVSDDFLAAATRSGAATHSGAGTLGGVGTLPGLGLAVAGRRVLTLRDLCASDEAAAANDLDRSAFDDDLVRLALATQLAQTIQLLHRNRIAYSDLTLGRVAIAGDPPRTMLTGCDPTVALRGAPTVRSSPTVPDLDTSRLALCVIRALAKGPSATQLTDPARVGALLGGPGVSLIARALAPSPAGRPSAEQISRYLTIRLAELLRGSGLIDPAAMLPAFDIAAQLRGTLPRLAVPSLPTVAVPQAADPLPRRPMLDADEHPPPRIELPPVGLDATALRSGLAANGAPDLPGMLASGYAHAYRQFGATLRDGFRTLRAAIDERTRPGRSSTDSTSDRPTRP
jgi:hypothetical protein